MTTVDPLDDLANTPQYQERFIKSKIKQLSGMCVHVVIVLSVCLLFFFVVPSQTTAQFRERNAFFFGLLYLRLSARHIRLQYANDVMHTFVWVYHRVSMIGTEHHSPFIRSLGIHAYRVNFLTVDHYVRIV